MSSGRAWLAIGAGLLTGGLAFAAMGAIGLGVLAPIAGGLAFNATTALVLGKNDAAGSIPGIGTVQGATGKAGGDAGIGNASIPDPEELAINTATEARPIPVVFGRVRIGGNIVRYDRSTFKSDPVYNEVIIPGTPGREAQTITGTAVSQNEGGKGGGGDSATSTTETVQEIPAIAGTAERVIQQLAGYTYRLSYDLAICMGPVDKVLAVFTNPGERNMLSRHPDKTGFVIKNPVNFVTAGVDRISRTIDAGTGFRGSCRFYQGSADQNRFAGDDYAEDWSNYRHVHFAHFKNFKLGSQPSPTTTIFEVLRLPNPTDENGADIAGFPKRGSSDSGNPAYEDANPAAAMWDLLTNDVWGAGVSHDQLDVESFKTAAVYFRDNNIGLSFALTSQSFMSEAINFMREHVQTILTWNGEQLSLLCLMDRVTANANRIKLTRDQISDPVFTRPTWPSTINELRVTFINRSNNHKRETVVVHDQGSIQALGRIQSRELELIGFSFRNLAGRMARRLLTEAAYPQATLKFRMNRIHSGISPGALIELVWPDWSDADTTTFWRVLEIGDDQADGSGLEISVMEDSYLEGYEGTSDSFTETTPDFEQADPEDDGDINLGDDATLEVTGDFGPGLTYEPNGLMTRGSKQAILLIQRRSGTTAFANWAWEIEGSGAATSMPPKSPWAFFGTLDHDVDVTRATARDLTIDVSLENGDDLTEILDTANFLPTAADDYSDLTGGPYALLLIGDEIMRVGFASDQTGDVVRYTGLLRGDMGTEIAAHSTGATVIFVPVLTTGYQFGWGSIPEGENIEFTADQVTNRGSVVTDTQITFFAPFSKQFDGRSTKPPKPHCYGAPVLNGSQWEIALRPRFMNRGAGTQLSIVDELEDRVTAIPSGYALRLIGYNSGGNPVTDADTTIETEFEAAPAWMPANINVTRFAFIPDTGEPGTCVLEIEATPDASVDTIRIFTIINGSESADYLEIDL